MTSPSFALTIPHAPWLEDRAGNMVTLRASLGLVEPRQQIYAPLRVHGTPHFYREFTERGPWSTRSRARWEAALKTKASHFLQLEDDVIVAPYFWRALEAMVSAWPEDVVCLAATHSSGPLVSSQGRRSYRTPRILGWGVLWPMAWTRKLLEAEEELLNFVAKPGKPCEDTFLAEFFLKRGVTPRHPAPTIVDHLHLPSTIEGFDEHTNTQASVTWRGYAEGDLVTPEWWKTAFTYLPPEWTQSVSAMMGSCHWCYQRAGIIFSPSTCAAICRECVAALSLNLMGIRKVEVGT